MPKFEDFKPPVEEEKKPEIAEENIEEAVEEQTEELKKESEKPGRFSGIKGALGKAAIAIAAVFGGHNEGQPAELPKKPSPEHVIPEIKYEPLKYSYKNIMEKQESKNEAFFTSKSLGDLLGGSRKIKDLGDGRFAVSRGKKYVALDQSALEKISEIQKKYTMQYGRTRFTMRAEAMASMRADLNDIIKREGKEIDISAAPAEKAEEKKPEEKKEAVKKPTRAKRTAKADKSAYSEDKGAYDAYEK